MPELFRLHRLEEALEILEAALAPGPLGEKMVPLAQARGRVVSRQIISPEDLPAFPRSVMDGYAVRAHDTFGASEGMPAYLSLAGEVLMGRPPGMRLEPGQAIKIPTGGMLPEGADAVVMVEHTQPFGEGTVEVLRPAAPGENLVQVGDDLRRGETLFGPGHRLRPQDLGALAGLGICRAPVWRRPRVGIISTGNELVPADRKPRPGQIRDSNSYALAAAAEQAGGEPVRGGIVPDRPDELDAALKKLIGQVDLLAVSAGTSVGREDLVPAALDSLGRPGVLVHGLAIRPGKPAVLAVAGGKPALGLPGHPVSALLVFSLVAVPLIRRMAGLPASRPHTARAVLSRSLASAPGRKDFYRVRLEREGDRLVAAPVLGKSALISTLARADGLVAIDYDLEGLAAGAEVEVVLFDV